MVVVISCGFQAVDTNRFRKKSLEKGKQLCESFHISQVREEIHAENVRIIKGIVLKETPSNISKGQKGNIYKVTVEVVRVLIF